MYKSMVILSLISSVSMADTLNAYHHNQLKQVHYSQKGHYAVVEGDIIIADLNQHSAVVIPKLGGTRWPQGIVPVSIDAELPFINKSAIYQAMMEWEKHSNLKFVELTAENRDQYQDYIHFMPAKGMTCSSWVGKIGGEQSINLAPRCHKWNTVHEIGHALGLWHEQSRADRNEYVKIVWDNIDPQHQDNFNQHLNDGKDHGPYNYESIMHYSPLAFSVNGEKTIVALQPGGEAMGQRESLSQGDIAAVNAMYPDF